MNPAHPTRGFTLVEVLVATALLSLVMLGLLTAMRSFAQTEARIDARIRIDDDLRVSERFLRATLATAAPIERPTAPGAQRQIDFSGGSESLRWIGVMPARYGAGGLYRFQLHGRSAGSDGPTQLLLEFFPYLPGFEVPLDGMTVQSRAMARGVGEVRFRYQDETGPGEQWVSEWPHPDRLPRRIGLLFPADGHPWPELVVEVVAAGGQAAGRGIASGPTVGPR